LNLARIAFGLFFLASKGQQAAADSAKDFAKRESRISKLLLGIPKHQIFRSKRKTSESFFIPQYS
jgi:hypothetical protein